MGSRFHNSEASTTNSFRSVFNWHDEFAKSRTCVLISNLVTSVNTYLTAGVFYSGFLAANDMNVVNLGIITLIPFFANLFSIFSPNILERFEKRKKILLIARFVYYTLHILGVTLIPFITSDPTLKVVWFAIVILTANIINALFQPGLSIWHIGFIPDKVRTDFWAYQQTCAAAVSGVIIIVSSVIADRVSGMTALTGIRFFAYFIALIDIAVLSIPKDIKYTRTEKIKLSNVIRLPVRCKPFLYMMIFILLWTFTQNLAYSTILNNYLLNDCDVPYLFICAIDASYALFLMFLSKYWKRLIMKKSWAKTFAIAAILHAPTTFLYAFTTGGNFWVVMLIVRLTQHVIGVGLNITYANLPYVNLPDTDRTNYMAFHQLVLNLGTLLGMLTATFYAGRTEHFVLNVFGFGFTSVQQLLLLQALFQIIVPGLMLMSMKKLNPQQPQQVQASEGA